MDPQSPEPGRETPEQLRLGALGGDPQAQFSLGVLYRVGQGVPADSQEAERWLTAAATQGHLDSQIALAQMYAIGAAAGGPDPALAAKWYEAAAEQGHPASQRYMGGLFYEGRYRERDLSQALRLWRSAAEQGEAYARFNLARLYWRGEGVPRNRREAFRLVRLVAKEPDVYREIVGGLPRRALMASALILTAVLAYILFRG